MFDAHNRFNSGEIRTAWKLLQTFFCAVDSTFEDFSKHVIRRHISNLQKPSKAMEFPACSHSVIFSAAVRQAAFLGVGSLNSSLSATDSIAPFKSFGPLVKKLALSSFGRSAEYLYNGVNYHAASLYLTKITQKNARLSGAYLILLLSLPFPAFSGSKTGGLVLPVLLSAITHGQNKT